VSLALLAKMRLASEPRCAVDLISRKTASLMANGQPMVSVDNRKIEDVGTFKHGRRRGGGRTLMRSETAGMIPVACEAMH